MNVPQIGQFITGQLIEKIDNTHYYVQPTETYENWNVLYFHQGRQDYVIGELYPFLIVKVDQVNKTIYLTSTEYGKLTISDRTLTQILRSVRTIRELLKNPEKPTSESIQELLNLAKFCKAVINKNRIDSDTIYEIMGTPGIERITLLRKTLNKLNSLLRNEQHRKVAIETANESRLDDFLNTIESNTLHIMPKLAKPVITSGGSSEQLKTDNKQKEKTTLTEGTKIKLKQANTTHQKVLDLLVQLLEKLGYVVEHNVYVDAFTRIDSVPHIFEVKSITKSNELSQCRQGLSQLYEYRYRHKLHGAILWLVLSRQPDQEWLADYLVKDRQIELIWLHGKEFYGVNVGKLFQRNKRI